MTFLELDPPHHHEMFEQDYTEKARCQTGENGLPEPKGNQGTRSVQSPEVKLVLEGQKEKMVNIGSKLTGPKGDNALRLNPCFSRKNLLKYYRKPCRFHVISQQRPLDLL